jgi:hypothetical protein
MLKSRREAEGNPNWFQRNWAEGGGYLGEVQKILREREEIGAANNLSLG